MCWPVLLYIEQDVTVTSLLRALCLFHAQGAGEAYCVNHKVCLGPLVSVGNLPRQDVLQALLSHARPGENPLPLHWLRGADHCYCIYLQSCIAPLY